MQSSTIDFLRLLAANNNREWFHASRDLYEAARADVLALTEDMIRRISVFDPEVRYLEPKKCLFRINRDIRFSPDKSPYKRHFGIYIARDGGARSRYSGYYIHIEPDACMLGGGLWCEDMAAVKRLRSIIDADHEELRRIVERPAFCRFFASRLTGMEASLKRVPRPFPQDHPAAEWLKLKQLCCMWHFPEQLLTAADAEDRLEEACRAMTEFSHWCNNAFFDPEL